ncbi:MAG: hypothetical protein ABIH90_00670 [Candidatus Aenigmatarchaeota archaeon]
MSPGFIGSSTSLVGSTYSQSDSMFRNGEFLMTNTTAVNVLMETAVALIAPARGFIMKTPAGEEPITSDSKTMAIHFIVCIAPPSGMIKYIGTARPGKYPSRPTFPQRLT